MKTETFYLSAENGNPCFVYKWMPENTTPRGTVQIAHGMAEHALRYQELARVLTGAGYAVYANDHQGHGKTARSPDEMGFFGHRDGWLSVVRDMHLLTRTIRDKTPDLPLFLMGHSMGSFLSREYACRYHQDINGLILSGTAGDPGIAGKCGILLARLLCRIHGRKSPSPLLSALTTGGFNRAFKPARTPSDWLSRDADQVDRYMEDPLCGFTPPTVFFIDMLSGLAKVSSPEAFNRIPADLPILIFSGDRDPAGENGRGVQQVYKQYRKAGIKDLSLKLYKEGRHEMINEINKDEVNQDIVSWLDRHCATP